VLRVSAKEWIRNILKDRTQASVIGKALAVSAFFIQGASADPTKQFKDSPPGRNSEDYIFRNWQTDDGLPENTVHSVIQTPDGYIWCTTFNGLARFDGVRFTAFDAATNPELGTSRLTLLGAAQNGRLVVTSEFNDVIVRDGGRFERSKFFRDQGKVIAEDETGRLWFCNFKYPQNGLWAPLNHEAGSAPNGTLRVILPASEVVIHSDGTVLRWHGDRFFRSTNGDTWEEVPLFPGTNSIQVLALWPGKAGSWVKTKEHLHLFNGKEVVRTFPLPSDDHGFGITGAQEDQRGNLWVSTWHARLFRFNLEEGSVTEITGFPGWKRTSTRSLLVDREDNVWVGLQSYGLLQVRPKAMRNYGKAEGLLHEIARSVAEDTEGDLWIATVGGLNRLTHGRIEPVPHEETFAWSFAPGGPGQMWFSTYGSGLYLYDHGQVRKAPGKEYERWFHPRFTFLFKDSKEALWTGNSVGLFRYDGTDFANVPLPVSGSLDVRAAAEGRDGTMYAGANGRGLFVRGAESENWKRFGREAGLEDEQVYSLHVDPSGVLWVGTAGGGLARYDKGGLTSLRRKVPELPSSVTGIQSDDHGFLWLASTRGIFRVKIADLNAIAANEKVEPVVYVYDRSAGLVNSECMAGIQPSVAKTRDGRIWFATTGGLVSFDPARIEFNPVAPPVVIERVASLNTSIDLTGSPGKRDGSDRPILQVSGGNPRTVTVAPGVDPIAFEFTGLSFAVPKSVRFRYRMEGLEDKWTKTEERKATYQRLPPGEYTFRVSACNNDGLWNEMGAALAIVQLPFFWQTGWFKIVAGATLALLVYGAHRYRLLQVEQVSRMRARIAADLHDEVGSNMGAVVLNSELLKSSVALSEAEREQLSDIHRVAQNTATAIREIGWFINPDFDYLDEMIVRMRELAERLFSKRELHFRAPETPPKTRLSLDFRRNVMAIYKEALHNIVRHSQAERVEISIQLVRDHFEIEIQDDGCGFDHAVLNSGQGLRNVRHRADALDAELEIKARNPKGTSMRLRAGLK
jgi:signal transduction histidine kinase/ligand-binding sensor domain-containing protein